MKGNQVLKKTEQKKSKFFAQDFCLGSQDEIAMGVKGKKVTIIQQTIYKIRDLSVF